ncbi:hypothetical protein [Azospirillum brasilense]|uniref:Uncharacterized protein n=1 Tax=Azospirillum brasilense TaxID=192 RepID=A0A6L3ARP4_AZOBR|nr:hypothetical protein [Azospirillum brasilense]KAA0676738.1 hypothetical protein DS837_30375 [Azospirillum brasilense]
MMERPSGYYWVRLNASDDWEPARWNAENASWQLLGGDIELEHCDPAEIGDPVMPAARTPTGSASAEPVGARDQKSRWTTSLTDLDSIGIADALRRDAGVDVTPESLEILAVAPALEQGFNLDTFIVAVHAGGRRFALCGREIGWSILSPTELIDEAAEIDRAVEMTLAVIRAVTQREA